MTIFLMGFMKLDLIMRKNVFILKVGKCQKKKENKRKVSNMEDKNEKLPSTKIQCEKTIYRKFLITAENTHFFV